MVSDFKQNEKISVNYYCPLHPSKEGHLSVSNIHKSDIDTTVLVLYGSSGYVAQVSTETCYSGIWLNR